MDSDDYDSKEERVEALKKEIKWFSDFENAEFELFNVNGFSNSRTIVPGASSWNYKFVIKTDPNGIDKWKEGMVKVDTVVFERDVINRIAKDRLSEWVTESEPECYVRVGDRVFMAVYRPEGIIYKSVVNL
jgi:hypothetical protein